MTGNVTTTESYEKVDFLLTFYILTGVKWCQRSGSPLVRAQVNWQISTNTWNYLSIHKFQRCNRRSLGKDVEFHPTLYWACDYICMLGLKSIHVSKRDSRSSLQLATSRGAQCRVVTRALQASSHWSTPWFAAMLCHLPGFGPILKLCILHLLYYQWS